MALGRYTISISGLVRPFKWRRFSLRFGIALTVAGGVAAYACGPVAADDITCTRESNPESPQPGPAVPEPVTLDADQAPTEVNLGDESSGDVVITATPPLTGVTADQISLHSPTRFKRSNEDLDTAYVDRPDFTQPQLAKGGGLIEFSFCIDTSDVKAGTYAGQINVGGPQGVEPAAITFSVNQKDDTLFHIGQILVIPLSWILLAVIAIKGAWDKQEAQRRSFKRAAHAALVKDWWFWVSWVVALVLVEIAIYEVYAKDASWGADKWGALFALGGTALAATGLGATIKALRPTPSAD